jgi:hypothetical protein
VDHYPLGPVTRPLALAGQKGVERDFWSAQKVKRAGHHLQRLKGRIGANTDVAGWHVLVAPDREAGQPVQVRFFFGIKKSLLWLQALGVMGAPEFADGHPNGYRQGTILLVVK